MTTKNAHEFQLENLSCANCAMKFEKNILAIPTVEQATVNFGASKVRVVGDITLADIEAAGAFDGIKVRQNAVASSQKKDPFYKQKEWQISLIALLLLIAAIISKYSLGENQIITVGLFIATIVVGGFSMMKSGLQNVWERYFDMKALMTIAVIGAAIIGEWQEAAVVVLLFSISEALEAYSMSKARQSIRELIDIAPTKARVRRGDEIVELVTDEITIGDILLVQPGQKIAMDGTVIKGQSTVNQAAITGESIPVSKTVEDEVFAGTLNEDGALEVYVTKRVEDTTLAKIIHLVEEAQAEKAPMQKFIDRFAQYYTPAVMIIAVLVAIIPSLITGDWMTWVYQGLAVLVVGCPCALVVSTPVAIVTAIGNAAKRGVLIKGGTYLEQLGRIDVVAFDKTGTLTKGKPAVTNVYAVSSFTEEQVIQYAASVDQFSGHPLARAVVHDAEEKNISLLEAEDFQSVTGKGVQANISGSLILLGSEQWIVEGNETLDANAVQQMTEWKEQGQSVIFLSVDGKFAGAMAVADEIRESSRLVIEKLRQIGITKLVMLTGDQQITAQAIGHQLGVDDVQASLLPDEKLEGIRQLKQQSGSVAMIGDGVNDAPALAAADVGIAMGGAGTDAALETADMAFMADDLEMLPFSIRLSRKTLRIIKENIMFALGLKIIALLLLIPGWLTLWIAIIADMGATLLVVLNSMRLIRVRK